MNTKQLTQGAMVCGLYGLLLLLNQQFALFIETSFPWIYVFPVLVYTAKTSTKPGFIVMISMLLMTFLFSGFTTWVLAGSSLLIGWLYGVGVHHRFSLSLQFWIVLLESFVVNAAMIFVWSNLFGWNLMEEFQLLPSWSPHISFFVFCFILVFLVSLLQAMVIHLFAIWILSRWTYVLENRKRFSMPFSSKWIAIGSIIIWILFFLCQNVIKCNEGFFDCIQILFILDMLILLYYGTIFFLNLCIRKNKRKWAFFVILFAFVPGINLIWIIAGLYDSLCVGSKLNIR